MKKQGFTLIELLAVIAVLAIILLIAVPYLMDMIENTRKEAFRDTGYMIAHSGTLFLAEDNNSEEFYYKEGTEYNANNKQLKYSGEKPRTGVVALSGTNNVTLAIHNGTYCAKKSASEVIVDVTRTTPENCTAYDVINTCDTWQQIAFEYNVNIGDLLIANNETDSGSSTCGRDILIPINAASNDNSNDDSGVFYKTYYSVGYVDSSTSFPYSFEYIIELGVLPLDISEIDTTRVVAQSVFSGLTEYEKYIVKRNMGEVIWPGSEPIEIDISQASVFNAHSATSSNMTVDQVEINCDAVTCYATIDVTVNNLTNVIPNIVESNSIAYTPLKFTVEFNGIPDACFTFVPATKTITDYAYTNPLCPANVIIPTTIGGVMVTTIGASAFASSNLTGVYIPGTITTIGTSAFQSNSINHITIPDTITSIGNHAFAYNSLTGGVVWNNNNFTTVGNWSDPIFEGSDIGSITLSSNVSRIPDYLFFATDSPITSYTVPSTVNIIGDYAFGENVLTSISIPPSVTTIESNAFLSNFITNLTIPATLTTIGAGAFQNNVISSITIPDTITSIGEHAFAYNPLAGGVTWNNDNFTSVGSWSDPIFEGSDIGSITLGSSISRIPNYLFFATDSPITSYTIPSTVNIVGEYAFGENVLTSISIPSSVTTIQASAFLSNPITTLTIPTTLTTIGAGAFQNNVISSITIPDTVTSIGEHAFADNPLTGGVTWNNDNFTSVGSWSDPIFEGSEIGSITLGTNVSRIPSYLFFATDSPITNYTVPSTVSVIGVYAFGENMLTTITIPSSITSIESQAFRTNPITSLTINNGVTNIAAEAFRYSSLTSVAVPNSVINIGTNCFSNTTLTSATIDNTAGSVTLGTTPFGSVTPTYLR